jgi:hypothetical protein
VTRPSQLPGSPLSKLSPRRSRTPDPTSRRGFRRGSPASRTSAARSVVSRDDPAAFPGAPEAHRGVPSKMFTAGRSHLTGGSIFNEDRER